MKTRLFAGLIVAVAVYMLAFRTDWNAPEQGGPRWTDGTNGIATPYAPRGH